MFEGEYVCRCDRDSRMTRSSADIIIIGAGIAGLAAGCYAQMNGYRSQIFEMHHLSGGLCTAWQRQGYVFDGCLHYLFGSGAGQPFYQLWQELRAIQDRQFVHHSEFMRVVEPRGKTLVVYSHPDRLEQHLKQLLTYERYTGNWQGASCGWLLTKHTLPLMIVGIRKTLPGPDHFYMVGQWVEPGGSVPVVTMSGRNVIQQICHEDTKEFITTTPDTNCDYA
jgi:phytoene dehydrogenase-like protein